MPKPWSKIIQEATLEAGREHARSRTDYKKPIDIFSIIESNNIVLMFQPLGALAGAYLPGNDTEGTPAGILINEKLPIAKQRFSAAHEYCHFLRKDPESLDTEEEMFNYKEYRRDDAERIAESFAGRFLMPRPLLINLCRCLNIDLQKVSPVDVYTLSLRLGTSYSATVNQLFSLKLIDEQGRGQLTIPPKQIKEVMGSEGLETTWNDIWQLLESDNGNNITPRIGDILKLELFENPSTGYMWSGSYPPCLEIIDEKWEPQSAIGSGGKKHITIKVKEPGTADITWEYNRPWDTKEILKSLRISIEIDLKRHGINEALLTG